MIAVVICRHSVTSFREDVVVAETNYQMYEISFFCNRDREGLTLFNLDKSANFSCEE